MVFFASRHAKIVKNARNNQEANKVREMAREGLPNFLPLSIIEVSLLPRRRHFLRSFPSLLLENFDVSAF